MQSTFSQARFAIAIIALFAALTTAACNQRSALPNDAGLVAPSPSVGPLSSASAVALFGLSVNPQGLFGTAPAFGVAILTRQAPAGGVTVALSSNDASIVTVPPSVTIPEGADRAAFPIATQTVAADRQVQIAGSGAGTSATAALSVWAVLPTFLSWVSEPGDPVGRGGFGRQTPATATFGVSGGDTGVRIQVVPPPGVFDSFDINFVPRSGGRLTVGVYENAARSSDATHPRLDIFGRGFCATARGRFEIREFGVGPNPPFSTPGLVRFDATFEYRCEDGTGALHGEIRYTAGAR